MNSYSNQFDADLSVEPRNSTPTLMWLPLGLIAALFTLVAPRCLADRATFDPTKTQVAYPLSTPPVIDGTIDNAE